jgi:DNA-binding MarR family transcriptional regulator
MHTDCKPDAVNAILGQWHRERPDLAPDLGAMGTIGRVKRCATLLRPLLDATFEKYGLNGWEFDVLATLRRSGAPYCLAPTTLFSALMITSGTMTHRLKGLESRALIERVPNREDARSLLVRLSPAGLELIDRTVTAHVENERQILSPIGAADLQALDAQLKRLLAVLEASAAAMDADAPGNKRPYSTEEK